MAKISALQNARYAYKPKLPAVLKLRLNTIQVAFGKPTKAISDEADFKRII